MNKSDLEKRLRAVETRLAKLEEIIPAEVARAQIHFQREGQWPEDASPRTIEMANAMIEASRAIMESV